MSERLERIAAVNQGIVESGTYRTADGTVVEVGAALALAVAGTRSYGPEVYGSASYGPGALAGQRARLAAQSGAHEPDALARQGERLAAQSGSYGPDVLAGQGERVSAQSGAHEPGALAGQGAHQVAHNVPGGRSSVEVSGLDTIVAARRLVAAGEQRVAVLNFASARNPGGGYLTGATAQEEDVCRKLLLYPCLLAAPDFYAAHRSSRDPFYSHRLIYSPGVPVIRDQRDELTAPMITLDVITSAAPNAGTILRDQPGRADEIAKQLTERAGGVLAAAADHGADALVLGAWGCGVFRNDPRVVAAAFRTHLIGGPFEGAFGRVVFAVVDRSLEQRNLRTFQSVFGASSLMESR